MALYPLPLLLLLGLLQPENARLAQAPSPSASIDQSTPATPLDSQGPPAEITLLRAQNTIIREYHEALLATVYWALGGLFAIAALLAGFGWWSNFKIYYRDKRRLQDDLRARVAELEARLNLRIESARSAIEREVGAKNEAHLNRLLSEVSDLRTSFGGINSRLTDLGEELRGARGQCEKMIADANKLISETSAELREVEELVWDLRKLPSNILLTQCQGLHSAHEAENPTRIKSILRRMKETLDEHFISADKALTKDAREIVERNLSLLADLRSTDNIQITEIMEMLSKVKSSE